VVDATPGSSDGLLIEQRGAVGWITLDRADVRNAITHGQRLALVATLSAWSADPTVRAVVITGSGGSFCAGADLRSNEGLPERPAGAPERIGGDLVRRQKRSAQSLIAGILDCEKPVIAALNGVAAGMGVHVALACDFVIAARGARLLEVFVSRGLVPDAGGAYLLTRLLGLQKVKEILFLGDALSAEQALALGLVNSVVGEDELEETVGALAERLASGPTRTLALTKWMINRAVDADRSTCFDDEAMAVEMNMHSRDAQEGLAAFVERRDVHYLGW
jgi:2-(1,2-epoxy-1,2-dihydrophenyl)acetyl-CoA isomerase